jgi:O-antigen/teichoic acid export membrane protein
VFALIPFYVYFLGKEEYTNLIVLQMFYGFLNIFFLSLIPAVLLYYYRTRQKKLIRSLFTSWFYFQLALALVFVVILSLFTNMLDGLLLEKETNSVELTWSVVLIGLQLLPFSIINTLYNHFRIIRKPLKVLALLLTETLVVSSSIVIVLVYFEGGIIEVLLCMLFGRITTVLLFLPSVCYFMNPTFFSSRVLKRLIFIAWPYFLIDVFTWLIISSDKLIGSIRLNDPTELVYLAIALQIVRPINIFAEIIRLALGPFLHSIQQSSLLKNTYQHIFNLTLYASFVFLTALVLVTPVICSVFSDKSILKIIYVLPLMGFANVMLIAVNQFSINYNIAIRNKILLWVTLLGGVLGMTINYILMPVIGYISSGYSQAATYLIIFYLLYAIGKRSIKLDIQLGMITQVFVVFGLYIWYVLQRGHLLFASEYLEFISISLLVITVISLLFFLQNKWIFKVFKKESIE